VERRRLDAARHGPLDRPIEHVGSVIVEAEHEARVDHDPEVVDTADDLVVITGEVLALRMQAQVLHVDRLETDEHAAHAGSRGMLDQVRAQDRVDRAGALEDAAHPTHPVEEGPSEARVAEEMVVEEVDVLAGHPLDLSEGLVHGLRVERDPAAIEGVLVAEVAVMWAAARDDDRVRAEVAAPIDEVTPDGRRADETAALRDIPTRG